MRRRIEVIVVLGAWFLATGAQWDVAQVFAWGRMFAGYSREMTLGAAVERTFSGEMCAVCHAVQKARQQERDAAGSSAPEVKSPVKAIDLCPLAASTEVLPPARLVVGAIPAARPWVGRGRMAPPLPPPRAIA